MTFAPFQRQSFAQVASTIWRVVIATPLSTALTSPTSQLTCVKSTTVAWQCTWPLRVSSAARWSFTGCQTSTSTIDHTGTIKRTTGIFTLGERARGTFINAWATIGATTGAMRLTPVRLDAILIGGRGTSKPMIGSWSRISQFAVNRKESKQINSMNSLHLYRFANHLLSVSELRVALKYQRK